MKTESDEKFMEIALREARKSLEEGSSPFGACITDGTDFVVSAHNTVGSSHDITEHAEMNAIRKASRLMGGSGMENLTIYCTGEPCAMCFSAIYLADISRVVIGADQEVARKYGFGKIPLTTMKLKELTNSQVNLDYGLMKQEITRLYMLWNAERSK